MACLPGDPRTTSTSSLEHMPPLPPNYEDNSLPTNVDLSYSFLPYPWVPSEQTLVWPFLPAQFDPFLPIWSATDLLHGYGAALTDYHRDGDTSSTINAGQPPSQVLQVEDTSAAPIAVDDSTGDTMGAIFHKHMSPQEQTACATQKVKTTE